MMEDFPTESYDGFIQLIRYSKKEEYLTMEHRWVNRLTKKKDISKKGAKIEMEELAANNEDIKKLRDFLSSLDLGDKDKMVDKKICDACDSEDAFFKLIFKDYDGEAEYYCPDCMANVVMETPEDVKEITALEAM